MILSSKSVALNPILGGGKDKFTLSAIYRVKSPESRGKVGVIACQNLSSDILDLTKKVSGPKILFGPTQGPAKLVHRKI